MSNDQQNREQMDVSTDEPKPTGSKSGKQKPKQGNAAQKRQDKHREFVGRKALVDFRSRRKDEHLGKLAELSLFEIPQGLSLSNSIKMSTRYPVSSMGISFAVSALYQRFEKLLAPYCSVYQLLRLSFAQFEFQRYLACQRAASFYPYDQSQSFNFDSGFKGVLNSHPDNFQVIVSIIETIGNVTHKDVNYIPSLPDKMKGKTHFGFSDMAKLITEWSTNPSDWTNNPLPGAIIRNNVLVNPEDFWPEGYSELTLREDAVAVMQALESMRSKYDKVAAKCSFTGIGRPAMLVSVSDREIGVPYTAWQSLPPVRVGTKRQRVDHPEPEEARRLILPTIPAKEYSWYSSVPIEVNDSHLGGLALVGITAPEWERDHEPLRLRTQYGSCQRFTEAWLTLFDWATPKVGRSNS